jgi:hypothetical protein
MGDDVGVAVALGNLAEGAARKGNVAEAREGFAAGIAASRALNSAHRTVEAIIQYAVFEASIDEHRRAIDVLDAAMEAAASGNLPMWEGLCGALRAEASQHIGDPTARAQFMTHASALYADPEHTSVYWPQLAVALGRADIEFLQGEFERAAILLGVVERLEDESARLDVVFEPRRVQIREALISTLGEQAWDTARASGRALTEAETARLVSGP